MRRVFGRNLTAAALALVAWMLAPIAAAAPPQVVLIEPEPGDAFLREALVRLSKELAAVGFEVTAGPGPDHDPRWELEHASAPDTLVTITLRRSGSAGEVDAWVLDRLSGKTLIRRIHVELSSPAAPTVLAVRTTELLRASLLEVTAEPSAHSPEAAPPPPPPVVARWMQPATPAFFQGTSVALGVSLLITPGLAAAGLPTLRVGHGLGGGFAARFTLESTVTPGSVSSTAGSAQIEQQLGELELVYAAFTRRTLVPFASLGAGAYRVSVTGQGGPAYLGVTTAHVAAAVDAGVGVVVRLTSRLGVCVDVHALSTLPRERVHIGPETAGTVGAPSWAGGVHLTYELGSAR